jgi:hypothetical protein
MKAKVGIPELRASYSGSRILIFQISDRNHEPFRGP